MKIHVKRFEKPGLAKCADTELEAFVAAGGRLLSDAGNPDGAVEVELKGKWYVLRGSVDCHRTRSQLFRLVPRVDGAQWIVDHIRVGAGGVRGAASARVGS